MLPAELVPNGMTNIKKKFIKPTENRFTISSRSRIQNQNNF